MFNPTLYNATSASTCTTSSTLTTGTGSIVWVTAPTGTLSTIVNNIPVPVPYIPDIIDLKIGQKKAINFPDGTTITFERNGSFVIDDKDAKVIYKANRSHDFNPFINASDKLEDFIKYCGDAGVRRGDMLGIPIKYFVQWLVIEAAKADGEPTSETLALPNYNRPRCRTCQRFMSSKLKVDRIEFCRPRCLEAKLKESA